MLGLEDGECNGRKLSVACRLFCGQHSGQTDTGGREATISHLGPRRTVGLSLRIEPRLDESDAGESAPPGCRGPGRPERLAGLGVGITTRGLESAFSRYTLQEATPSSRLLRSRRELPSIRCVGLARTINHVSPAQGCCPIDAGDERVQNRYPANASDGSSTLPTRAGISLAQVQRMAASFQMYNGCLSTRLSTRPASSPTPSPPTSCRPVETRLLPWRGQDGKAVIGGERQWICCRLPRRLASASSWVSVRQRCGITRVK